MKNWQYYELQEDFCRYPKGLIFFLVESRDWWQMGQTGRTLHTDGMWIGVPNRDNEVSPLASWCITREGLLQNPDKFKRVYPKETKNV